MVKLSSYFVYTTPLFDRESYYTDHRMLRLFPCQSLRLSEASHRINLGYSKSANLAFADASYPDFFIEFLSAVHHNDRVIFGV